MSLTPNPGRVYHVFGPGQDGPRQPTKTPLRERHADGVSESGDLRIWTSVEGLATPQPGAVKVHARAHAPGPIHLRLQGIPGVELAADPALGKLEHDRHRRLVTIVGQL